MINNKYHREVKQSLELLATIAEESGQYGEAKEQTEKAIDTLFTFINNRI